MLCRTLGSGSCATASISRRIRVHGRSTVGTASSRPSTRSSRRKCRCHEKGRCSSDPLATIGSASSAAMTGYAAGSPLCFHSSRGLGAWRARACACRGMGAGGCCVHVHTSPRCGCSPFTLLCCSGSTNVGRDSLSRQRALRLASDCTLLYDFLTTQTPPPRRADAAVASAVGPPIAEGADHEAAEFVAKYVQPRATEWVRRVCTAAPGT